MSIDTVTPNLALPLPSSENTLGHDVLRVIAALNALDALLSGTGNLHDLKLVGAITAPTATPGDSSTLLATTAFVQAAVAALIASAPTNLNTLNKLAAALGNDSGFSVTVTNALALKAPLANPIFTGNPQGPTVTSTDNSTKLATTAFVQTALAALVASAPAALDTLNELAAALGNDANFATTIATALGLKAPLASPVLTGIPQAPTAAGGTNTAQIATTAFVQAILTSPALLGAPTAPTAGGGTNTAQIATTAFVQAILTSPALLGAPTAPTAGGGTNTAQIATTAFVQAALAALTPTTAAAITAGTNAQGQGALTSDLNYVTVAAANPSGNTLATATVGRRQIVWNFGANPINVYPATGAKIDGLATNAAFQIPVGAVMTFWAQSTTQWRSLNAAAFAISLFNTNIGGIKNATYNSEPVIAGTSGAQTVDWTSGNNIKQTEPTGSITYTFTAPPGPCHLQLKIDSDGVSTAQTITWPATVKWLSQTWAGVNNKVGIVNFWYDGTNYWATGMNQV
jgi:hypothetical protein